MVEILDVADVADPRVADYLNLTDAELRRKLESGRGLFVAESVPVIGRLFASGHRVRSVLVTPKRYSQLADVLASSDVTVYVAPQEVLNEVVGFDLHRGAVALAERRPEPPFEDLLGLRRLAVLEGLNDLENLGAIFRSAAALGIEGILLDPTCADPYHRRVVRVSMGTVLDLVFRRLTAWPDALDDLRRHGFDLVALTPAPEALDIDAVAPPAKTAVMLGSEGSGLSPEAVRRADVAVRIPMTAGIDSLNVGHAAAIAFHHFR